MTRAAVQSTQHYGAEDVPNTRADAEVTIADGDAGPIDDQAPFERGETLGRYVVLETLGRGGMGIVLAAYDSKLDRKVALKLLRPHASGDPENHARLLREAKALAKLSHPFVVSVYDVGELRDQVFIAMEFIDGPNLREWTREEGRTPQQIVTVMRDAARGLQAAHDAGIVHRDFKPDNVLIGSDGRARVTDFGLALPANVAVDASEYSDSYSGSGRLTETGMVMGTPAYMPIEQHVGYVTDHRSDQFSFCVTLYEALYGVRPFSGNTANEYCLAIRRAEFPPPAKSVRVPRRVQRAMLDGLAAKPEDRHPSMHALLRAMTPRTRSRRTWLVGGLGGLALGAGAVMIADPPQRPCSSFDDRLAEVYDDADKHRILAAFTGTGLPYAQASFDATASALDEFAERWIETARAACMASERGEQSDRMLDLRMNCLDRARARLSATVDVLREADGKIVGKGAALASSQAELDLCEDLEILERTSVLPTDAEEAAQIHALFELLHRVETLRAAGRKEDAKMLYAEQEARLEASEHPPVVAEALWTRGRLLGTDNQATEAIALFERAHLLALEHGLDALAAKSASSMSFYLGEFVTDLDQAEHYIGIAEALAKASGSTRIQAAVKGNHMTLLFRQARFDEAARAAKEELELASRGEHPSALLIAEAKVSLAHAVRLRDGPKAALPLLHEARSYVHTNLGTIHPALLSIHDEIANALQDMGEHDESYVERTAALEQARQVYGEGSLDETYALANMATALGNVGRKDEALEMFAKVDEGMIRALGRDHPVRAAVLNNMGSIYADLDDWKNAGEKFEGALRIAQLNADGPSDAVSVLARNTALVHIYEGNPSSAKPLADLALEQSLEVYGEDNMNTATAYSVRGRVALLEDDYAAARTHLERATEIGHDSEVDQSNMEFFLARALVEDPNATAEDRRRGMRLARSAEKVLAEGQDVEGSHQEVLEWLDQHAKGFAPG